MFNQSTPPNKKSVFMISAIVTMIVVLWIFFSPMGLLKYYQIRKELNEVQAANQELSESNEKLRAEIDKLKNDPAFLEELARKEYGLIKKNEIIFQFTNKQKR
ncbi:MAG: septum formation initiator family protein [Proteobacteria bacterium]|nr:septum formation initiator family protein [Pseudomonadota bacterium]MBU1714872.1 septum formation initiator family protein [Pseudomonadota bacterium]